ncbi:hypothetical protein BCF50_3336 [Chryseobacterium daecheongense]|uniref:Uncharacterized protein n=1 Tax=Chryseobacterium daecheongense TaxID=192389 RepID=A0ABY2FS24_9FLAO|nr:hypothetical protein BCF50_3336 [Chryseobacterium daecheongense]
MNTEKTVKKKTKNQIIRKNYPSNQSSPKNKAEISNSFFHRIISLLKKEELI